ncbi:MAG: adenylosuccinate synthase [Bacteroidetes bacterium]|nr:adenylosuccinate synthase [Bacteroidota bacterium]
MSVSIIVGAQWGDEGKGKIVDYLSEKADIVARYQGGANAGHTLVFNSKKYILHLIPSGILHKNIECVIGNGVVIDPIAFTEELNMLAENDIDISNRLFISENANIVLPIYKKLDLMREKELNTAIGTTGRGIGPAYTNKISRTGIRVHDIRNEQALRAKILAITKNDEEIDKIDAFIAHCMALLPFIKDTAYYMSDAINKNKNIILEGAQGALLDIDYGTYPFVTSSNTTSGGACTGAAIPPTKINKVLGITKAYCTRVGNGPFPTEQVNAIGEMLSERGFEIGSTTGRKRRCGWLDLVALKYSVMINGITEIVITKLDVLDAFDEIKVATQYKLKGALTNMFPVNECADALPEYTTLKGWQQNIAGLNDFNKLPSATRDYIKFIEDYVEVPISIVSTGPDRQDTIFM